MLAIEARDLRKVYVSAKKAPGIVGGIRALFSTEKVEKEAVKGINLTIEQGEVVGFLGPNGAGKTTTLKMLSGILHPTSGTARVVGYEPWLRDPRMLGQMSLVMGNKMQLWWDLPAWDSFTVLKELYEVPDADFKRRTDRLISDLDLSDKINTQVRRLSLGERMKCELVAALLHAPKVLFLDEPTIGLDVVSQKRIRDFLRDQHREDGSTIILTSHYMQDVQELCERVVVIDQGAIVFEGTLDTLSERFADTRRVRLTLDRPVLAADLAGFGKVIEQSDVQVLIEVPRHDTARATGAMLQSLPVSDVAIEEVEMDEIIRDLFSHSGKSFETASPS
jgi:ABC-2 type transport system ATP-binding protein